MGFGGWGLGFRVAGLVVETLPSAARSKKPLLIQGDEHGVWGLGFGVWGLGFEVWGLGFRVRTLGLGGTRGERVRNAGGGSHKI